MSKEHEEQPLSTADIAAATQPRPAESRVPQVPPMPRNEMDGGGEQLAPLFDARGAQDMRTRWTDIQAGFVDDPKQAVQRADELVAQALQDLARSFARHREQIEADAKGGDEQASTENLRIALRRYRSFFERLLSI